MENFNKNKKGFLLAEETLKIIIAVICLIFLVYLVVMIYNSSTSEKKIEEAKGALSRIDTIISSLDEGVFESQDILAPSGWYLYSFVEQEKPNSCLNTNCLCICQKSLIVQLTSQQEKCDKRGACLPIPKLAASRIDLKIRGSSNPLFIEIRKQGGKILVQEAG